MKAGLLSFFKIFEKKKKVEEEQRVPIDELDSWVADRVNDELRGICGQGDQIRRRIQGSILSIKQVIEEMVGESKRSALSLAIDKVVDDTTKEVLTFEDIAELRDGVAQDMTHLGELWSNYKRIAKKDARSYSVRVYAQWKQIDGDIARLNTLIKTHSSKVTALKHCQDQAKLLTARVKEVREMAGKLKASEDHLQSLESTRASIEIQIEHIKSTREFEASVKVRGELLELENRRTEISSRVHNGFSSLTRPIGKYGYMADLSNEKRRLLDAYIGETPSVLSATMDPAILEILADLRRHILLGQIEIKNPEKTVSSIEEMMGELPRLGQEYRALTGRMEALQSRVNTTVVEDFKGLEAKLREAGEAIGRVKLESKETGEEQVQLRSEIDAMVGPVERAVYENFGIPLRLGGIES